MEWYHYLLIGIAIIILAIFITSYVCFRMTCYIKRPKELKELNLPEGNFYEPYTDQIIQSMYDALNMPHEKITIKSFDGLTLHARYYEYAKDAPIEILFHGYKGDAIRDLGIGIKRCFKLKHSVLLVDQRGCGLSEGHALSFGINEHRDCLEWIKYLINHFGDNVKIILTGVSMGAATVVIASGLDLPKNVIGILADCGYDSAKNIIKKCIKEMHLSPDFFYPFVKLGARIFGGFNLDELSPVESIKNCQIPTIFIHGEADDFIPWQMSQNMYDACNVKKRIVVVPKATHGLSYLVNPELYIAELSEFFKN